ncbi:MAG: outer membrane protein assembly factor BamD, partial [Alphaproteobacteria bacterium]|nr:outer membrane protein assembly factor BamD [Alphaproteobacteria bacterium]
MRFSFPNVSLKSLLAAALLAGLCACAAPQNIDAPSEEPVEILYNKGADALDRGEYREAAKLFAEVDRQHPYSQWAARAQLMEAYAYHASMDYDDAIKTLDTFIELHPGNKDVAYAHYLRALCNYERISDVRRDQTSAREALKGFRDVISRFPETEFAKDANLKMALINDHLAGAEMDVGRYYIKQRLYIAAIGRFKTVIEKYQTTSHVPEALERLVE